MKLRALLCTLCIGLSSAIATAKVTDTVKTTYAKVAAILSHYWNGSIEETIVAAQALHELIVRDGIYATACEYMNQNPNATLISFSRYMRALLSNLQRGFTHGEYGVAARSLYAAIETDLNQLLDAPWYQLAYAKESEKEFSKMNRIFPKMGAAKTMNAAIINVTQNFDHTADPFALGNMSI